jgi:hypothetical protein
VQPFLGQIEIDQRGRKRISRFVDPLLALGLGLVVAQIGGGAGGDGEGLVLRRILFRFGGDGDRDCLLLRLGLSLAVGSLLIVAGADLAISRRLFDGKAVLLVGIGAAALAIVTLNPALGLVLGWIAELIRAVIVRRLIPERPRP